MRATAARSGTTAGRARQGLAGDAASGINRGVAVLGDRVFMVTDNAHLFALHRFTGQLIWDVEMADSRQNYGVHERAAGGQRPGRSPASPAATKGVRGFLDAYKASTGERVWRFWTIPAPGEPGSETWSGPRHRARLRRDLAHRHLRSRGPPALLADRQSLSRLQRRRAQGRQPVHRVRAGARSGDRES